MDYNMNEPKFNVTDIEFDFTDSQGELDKWEQDQIVKNNIGVWEADCEEDLIEEITAAAGWCIKSIDYDIQLEDYSLGNQDDTFIDINNTGGKY